MKYQKALGDPATKSGNEYEQEKLFYTKNVCDIKPQTSKIMPDYIYIHNELKRKKQTKVTLSLLYSFFKKRVRKWKWYWIKFNFTKNESFKSSILN